MIRSPPTNCCFMARSQGSTRPHDGVRRAATPSDEILMRHAKGEAVQHCQITSMSHGRGVELAASPTRHRTKSSAGEARTTTWVITKAPSRSSKRFGSISPAKTATARHPSQVSGGLGRGQPHFQTERIRTGSESIMRHIPWDTQEQSG